MKNLFGNKKNKVDENNKNIEFDLKSYMLENANILYVPNTFNIDNFIESTKKYMQTDLKLDTKTSSLQNFIFKIDYSNIGGIKKSLGVSGEFSLFILCFEQEILYIIKPSDWLENPNEKESLIKISSWFEDSYEKEIGQFFKNTSLDELLKKRELPKIDFSNIFIEKISLSQQIWFYSIQDKNEIMLGCFDISVKELPNETKPDPKLDYKLIYTTNRLALTAVNKRGGIQLYIDLADFEINVNKSLIKNEIIFNEIKINPTKNTMLLFSSIEKLKEINEYKRIKNIAKLNFENNSLEYAKLGLEILVEKQNSFYDKLLIFYINTKTQKVSISNTEDDEQLRKIINGIIDDAELNLNIRDLFNDWKFLNSEKIIVLQLMNQVAENEEQRLNFKGLYSEIRDEFLKNNKDSISKTIFEINYSKFLINSGSSSEAIEILNKLLKNIPDESVMDILPSSELNITENTSGEKLHVEILDLLVEAKTDKESHENTLKLAQLQPLNKNRIEAVIASIDEEIANRAKILLNLLFEDDFTEIVVDDAEYSLNLISDKVFENELRYPATKKQASFYPVQKWLSKINSEDYSTVKSFSEKLDINKDKNLYHDLFEIKKSFRLDKLEYYIARGEKSIGIRSYSGDPDFVVIGYKHLDADSEYFLSNNELKFLIASEISHIHFKHTPITSSDVWRGVSEKGHLFLDTLLTVVPVVGILGKAVQNVCKLNTVSKLLKLTETLSKGGELIAGAVAINSLYKNNTKSKETKESKESKEYELLALSRIMQYTADRVGLIFSGNMKSAIRAIIMSSKHNYTFLEQLKTNNLHELINKKNPDNTFENQDIALRIANLFSFYLSESYYNTRKIMIKVIDQK